MAAPLTPEALRGADMFGNLDDVARADVLAAGKVRTLPPGKVVFSQGDPGTTCHTLLDGRIKIVQTRPDGSQSVIRFIGPGEMYGTVAALMGKPFPADAVTVVESLEVYWTVAAMRELMARYPEIAMGSAASAGHRLFEMQDRVGEMAVEKVEQRIAHTLLRLVQQAGRRTERGIEIDFPITRQELSEMAGSTLHTVSRTLASWDDRGVTGSARKRIIVRDMDALTALAEPA
ncbi:Crp/Fnr family transcriptional regulator [Caulobacter sp. RHG1]|uniref:Crp/Fnr family transcriptional regulator n=1 Tax=Caulobacter sp. (strain RHG1) TaxID=2545762 RepID=UPI0015578C70|nr:Crp/Fnr family transcriptional regulator [Caulobacter sp. RHG1]NQE61296.1 Nitric oxide -responding transcriptional regulator NnrR (Crp/Fnr family) [Caulobacter sp. RHG1]